MQLRPYQSDCVASVLRGFETHRSVLAVLATGLGKTVIGATAVQRLHAITGGRSLWLAHREELIQQAADAIRGITGLDVVTEMGDSYSDEGGFAPAPVVVASVQTLSRPRRLRRFRPQDFGLIVTDEAHHALARSYRRIYKSFRHGIEERDGNPDIRHLGITATPKRGDNLAMGREFESVVFEYDIATAQEDGWLVPVRQATAIVHGLRLSDIRVVKGEFNQGELEAMLVDPERKIVLQMVKPILDHAGSSPCIVFTVGKRQAHAIAQAINDARPASAIAVTDETPKDLRKALIADFKAGRVQFFCNCGIATEGFDALAVALVAIARPTKSLSLYSQMLGRATRPLRGIVDGPSDAAARKAAIALSGKPHATILDFVGNVDRHGEAVSVCAADVLGGKYSDETRAYAARSLRDDAGARPVDAALKRAEAELALMREEEERVARVVAAVDYDLRYLDDGGAQREYEVGQRGEPATAKQIWKLCSLGVPRHKAERVTKRQASGWIGRLLAEDPCKN